MATKEKQGTGHRERTTKRSAAPKSQSRSAQNTQTQIHRSPRRRTTVQSRPESNAPDVVYTPATPFSGQSLLLRLGTVVAIVLALIFGISIFFKVDKVTVSGAEKYTPYMVQEASGIKTGENLLTLDKVRASGKIITALPYVDTVRIAIQLPDTVHIEITEMDVVYALKDSVGAWWLMTSDGRVVVKTDSATAGTNTQILGLTLEDPVQGEIAKAAGTELTLEDGTTQTASGDSRLAAVLSILQYLEESHQVGKVVSVDVTSPTDIRLRYGQQYEVLLGDTTELGYKINYMISAIAALEADGDYHRGTLDLSFTRYPGEAHFQEVY